jgi:hypothetical protein
MNYFPEIMNDRSVRRDHISVVSNDVAVVRICGVGTTIEKFIVRSVKILCMK